MEGWSDVASVSRSWLLLSFLTSFAGRTRVGAIDPLAGFSWVGAACEETASWESHRGWPRGGGGTEILAAFCLSQLEMSWFPKK